MRRHDRSAGNTGTVSRMFQQVKGGKYRDIVTGELWTWAELKAWRGLAIVDDMDPRKGAFGERKSQAAN